MAKIVSVVATSHILMSPAGVMDKARHVVNGIKEIGRRVRATNPDILMVISSDHMFNLNLALQPPFCVGVSDTFVPFGDMDIEQAASRLAWVRPGICRARGLKRVRSGKGRRVSSRSRDCFATDNDRSRPEDSNRPAAGEHQHGSAPDAVALLRVGQRLAHTIESDRPKDERVAILATGGLSHWLNIPRHGEVSEQFDRQVMNTIISGRAPELAKMSRPRSLRRAAMAAWKS